MFTGLVADLGRVECLERSGDGARLELSSGLAAELELGGSIAANGVCLTATDLRESGFSADLVATTLAASTVGSLVPGESVNLELPCRVGDPLGGHMVAGHVDGVGVVRDVDDDHHGRLLGVEIPSGLLRYVAAKGSIAIDGVSLTVATLEDDRITLSLIPETLARTNLGAARPGRDVNIEVDAIAKHVERLMAHI